MLFGESRKKAGFMELQNIILVLHFTMASLFPIPVGRTGVDRHVFCMYVFVYTVLVHGNQMNAYRSDWKMEY